MSRNEEETFKLRQIVLERDLHALSFITTSDKIDVNCAKNKAIAPSTLPFGKNIPQEHWKGNFNMPNYKRLPF